MSLPDCGQVAVGLLRIAVVNPLASFLAWEIETRRAIACARLPGVRAKRGDLHVLCERSAHCEGGANQCGGPTTAMHAFFHSTLADRHKAMVA